MGNVFSVNEIISFLENRTFDAFRFQDGCASIDSHEAGEILIEAPDGIIAENRRKYVTDMLHHLDKCIKRAHLWLEHFYLKRDQWYPDALDQGFAVCGMYFGTYTYGHDPEPVTNGFTLSFRTVAYFPCIFTVKFSGDDIQPFAVEEWLE